MVAKHEKHKERLERQLREDREAQRQQMETLMVANMEGKRRCRKSVNPHHRSRGLKAAITGLALCAKNLPQSDSSDSDSSDSDSNDFDLAVRDLATIAKLDLNDSDSDDECVIM